MGGTKNIGLEAKDQTAPTHINDSQIPWSRQFFFATKVSHRSPLLQGLPRENLSNCKVQCIGI
jgi:hypothetical protein